MHFTRSLPPSLVGASSFAENALQRSVQVVGSSQLPFLNENQRRGRGGSNGRRGSRVQRNHVVPGKKRARRAPS